ncbi:7-carboxy-7-deazaguanine synthase QueE [Pedobacter yulinensis]|uniref:7-carboxy-7-deazaguanine synthase n=1 Tax=Pedobacter yulinensis TaxID=2126353 RepID=A0A2T3HKS0_9SPHI|nr:7-carboxy-7-deazaguanine synthase QueE [Pedobacter yulinensis]PST83003.1 7-carboxy-7-deazaguanine synthase QueE [Pedobacter yulinensis]
MAVQVPEDGSLLPLMEEFYTIQGEGFHTGKAAYFIRLGGCDVGCHWCDVKESWDAEMHPLTAVEQIVANAEKHPGKAVVITGGEPLIYNLDNLTAALQQKGIKTFIETSGAYPLSGHWDWICLSPKKFKAPRPDMTPFANELKVIVFNKSDFDWAEKYAETVSANCKLYLQPEWSRSKEVTPLIIDYVMQHPKWEISLQTHKFLNIP